MKSFKDYLLELETKQVVENSNLPSAVDSTSPISGRTGKLKSKKKKKNETIPNNIGGLRSVVGSDDS